MRTGRWLAAAEIEFDAIRSVFRRTAPQNQDPRRWVENMRTISGLTPVFHMKLYGKRLAVVCQANGYFNNGCGW